MLPSDASAQRKFTFGYDQPRTTAYGIAADLFDAKLKELSGGKLSIDQFPGAQLGQEPVMLQKLRSGDIDFVITATANAATLAPQAGVFSLHFIFRDKDHLAKTLADPGVSKAFREMIKESVQGAQVLGLITMGMRNIYSKKEITKVDDIKGMKIRVQATKTEDTHFPAYGTQTVHMPFGEVYTSLQTGVVNAAENGINVYHRQQALRSCADPLDHRARGEQQLPLDQRQDLEQPLRSGEGSGWWRLRRTSRRRSLRWRSSSRRTLAERLKKLGVKVVENVDKSGFMKAAAPIQDQLAKELGPHAVKILELVRNVK